MTGCGFVRGSFVCFCRPLTEVEIAERREAARKRHQAKMAAPVPESIVESQVSTEMEEENCLNSCVFLAFSRVFSGVVKRGQKLFVLQPLYDAAEAILVEQPLPPHVSEFTVSDLYILMGRGVVPVEQVPAGNVVGIAGLEDSITKSATISSTLTCPSFGAMNMIAAPIVRVAIEPMHAMDLRDLVNGMRLLNQADPSVEISVQETGEHVLAAAGEVHLQKCLDDLEKEYARVKLKVSEPIIPFRETLISPPKVDMVNEEISAENEVRLVKPRTEPTAKRLVGSEALCVCHSLFTFPTVVERERKTTRLLWNPGLPSRLPTKLARCSWRLDLCLVSLPLSWRRTRSC